MAFFASSQRVLALTAFVVAAVFPLAAQAMDQGFYIGFATRMMIYVMAVTSLNLLVGYAGLVSFGHAAYFGVGAYTLGMLTVWSQSFLPSWFTSAWIAWPAAMVFSGLLALGVGALALRTRQVYFIMITLAFSQMVYFLFIGMESFGSDNGMSLPARSVVGLGVDLANDTSFYYVVLGLTAATLLALAVVVRSRFGVVIQGISENESRMAAVGFPVYRYKLACFVVGGAVAGLAGALLANQNTYISPRLLDWTQSGSLLVMLILGGVGYRCGGVYGVVLLLLLEEVLSSHTAYWQFFVGLGVIAVVLLGNNGIASLIERLWRGQKGHP
ncbi:branched-chain amino acid ABC transporter permease [Hydrogenophaga sp.]|uniref:branched-chain amino acid ABC transporter permease n=1 Tax=Hydrogenophaga sp. TaxID=1904254 RepID=UPI00356AED04